MRTPIPALLAVAILLTATLAGCDTSATVGPTGSASHSPASTTVPRPSAQPPTASRRPARRVDPDAHKELVDHVRWITTTKGRQLQVFPTRAGRTDVFPTAAKRAWNEVLAHAPNAGSAGMYDQFLCHWNYARVVEPDKPSWDLEPWRPAVGYTATVAALCNPGGSEG